MGSGKIAIKWKQHTSHNEKNIILHSLLYMEECEQSVHGGWD